MSVLGRFQSVPLALVDGIKVAMSAGGQSATVGMMPPSDSETDESEDGPHAGKGQVLRPHCLAVC